jgi:hypothetical protein
MCFGKLPLQRMRSDGQAFKLTQLLVSYRELLDGHTILK